MITCDAYDTDTKIGLLYKMVVINDWYKYKPSERELWKLICHVIISKIPLYPNRL